MPHRDRARQTYGYERAGGVSRGSSDTHTHMEEEEGGGGG